MADFMNQNDDAKGINMVGMKAVDEESGNDTNAESLAGQSSVITRDEMLHEMMAEEQEGADFVFVCICICICICIWYLFYYRLNEETEQT
jgi:hypothetical protein